MRPPANPGFGSQTPVWKRSADTGAALPGERVVARVYGIGDVGWWGRGAARPVDGGLRCGSLNSVLRANLCETISNWVELGMEGFFVIGCLGEKEREESSETDRCLLKVQSAVPGDRRTIPLAALASCFFPGELPSEKDSQQ
jgi:hypothetical protein